MANNFVDIRDDDKFYYQAMRKTIVQFLDLFDGIIIGRYDSENGNLLKYVNVPFKFAPKSKFWYWNEKIEPDSGRRIKDKVLPMIACNMTNIEHASDRKVNTKYRARTRIKEDNNIERFFNPVPYNYTFDVLIAAEYMVDIIQIMERILPFFDSHLYVRLVIPELDIVPEEIKDGAHPLDIKVIYEGSSIDDTTTFDEADYRVLIRTLSFRVEGYLFKPKYTYPIIRKTFEEFKTAVDDDAFLTITNYGLSADKYPLSVPKEDMEGARYDDDIKLLYKYERE